MKGRRRNPATFFVALDLLNKRGSFTFVRLEDPGNYYLK